MLVAVAANSGVMRPTQHNNQKVDEEKIEATNACGIVSCNIRRTSILYPLDAILVCKLQGLDWLGGDCHNYPSNHDGSIENRMHFVSRGII